ncbi:MAG: nitrite reductase [Armatimonadetes bacterium]|nr:nitrite reductase [Armatimonadota bacterium]
MADQAKETAAQRAERIKREKDGLDVFEDIVRYSRLGFDAIDPEDRDRFKWYGVYQQKPNEGHFMLRLRLPNGEISASQLDLVAELTDRYARGYGDVTTRQNIQLHWLTIEDLPDVLTSLREAGISSVHACGDTPRVVVGCPVHGADCDEIHDARDLLMQVNGLFVGNREFSNLPRKFKMSIGGCALRCAQPEINDVGICAVTRERRGGVEVGFDLSVGGGLSTQPKLGVRLPVFLRPEQVAPTCLAVGELFREHGNRDKRTAARLKFLVEEWGGERFLEDLQRRVDFTFDPDVPPVPELPRQRDHLGIRPQKQAGLHYVGLATRLGRLTGEQMRVVASLAREFGDGTIRFTNNQNVIVLGVPTAQVDEVVRLANNALLPPDGDVWQRNFVACTGAQFCNLAVTETKRAPGEDSPAEQMLTTLQARLAHFQHFVRINYNGCPNSCGQHWIADIGLQGVKFKDTTGTSVEGVLVTVAGGLGRTSRFSRPTGIKLPLPVVGDALVGLFSAFEAQATEAEDDLGDWLAARSDDELRVLLGA